MAVLPFRWDLLPRVTRAELAVLRALEGRAAAADLEAPELERLARGPVRVATGVVRPLATREVEATHPGWPMLRVDDGGAAALLALDPAFAVRAAGQLLGYDEAELAAPRPLGAAEAGALQWLAAHLLARAGLAGRVAGPGRPDADVLPDPWTLAVELEVALGPRRGRAVLLVPERRLHAAPRATPAVPPDVDLRLAVIRARAALGADRVRGLRAGDVVLFPDTRPRLALARRTATVALDGAGRVTLETDFAEDPMADDLLEHAEVELAIQLGHVTINARRLGELRPGSVLELDRPLGGPVEIWAGKRLVGRGELVDVDGQLGVRLTERLI